MLIVLAIFIAFSFMAIYAGLTIKHYTINTDKLLTKQSIRIVLIADLHSHIYGDKQSEIAMKIAKQKPDIIALAGDIADDGTPIEGTKQFLQAIQGLAPTYYVTGNHEFWSNDIVNIRAVFRSFHVTILANTYEKITVNGADIIIAGVDDPDVVRYEKPGMDWKKEMNNSFAKLKDQPQYMVLLSHRPELVALYQKTPFDLVLSGHSHGGQVRIPFLLNGLLAPNQGFFPKYAGGLYQYGNMTHIVSRGVSYSPRLPRIFNPPEIVVIELLPKHQ
ncbi:MAG: metallophosphoesterase [Hyphomonadaceae bacterium]|nr:metallophosphoesterase [Clostridia bacterium]